MDPINPIAGNPEALNQEPTPKATTDNHLVTVVSMAIFVLLSLAAVAFLYYQNQQLKTMLASYQAPVTSPTPTATFDPTANWKTFTSTKYNFAFKYPGEWKEFSRPVGPGPTYADVVSYEISPASKFTVLYFASISDLNDWVVGIKNTGLVNAAIVDQREINGNTFIQVGGLSNNGNDKTYFIKAMEKGYLKIWIEPYDQTVHNLTFEQILSTFKFLPTTTAIPKGTQVACTQEAKLCPNGSYVGRTGPNCEFAACPTP